MTVTKTLDHEEAIILAVDRIDFPLSVQQGLLVDDHMTGCDSCTTVYDAIKEDDAALSSWDWETDSQGDGWDDDEYSFDEDDKDDDKSSSGTSDDWHEEETSSQDGKSSESDSEISLSGNLEDDDEDSLEANEGLEADQVEKQQESKQDRQDSEDAKEDAEIAAMESGEDDDLDATDVDAISGGTGGSGSAEDLEEDLEAEAKAVADAMSDTELAGLEEDLDEDLPACVAEGVDDSAEDAGVRVSKQDRRDAERSVRAQDGVEKTDFGKVAISRSTRGLTHANKNGTPKKSGAAAAAIRNAVLRSRGGHSATTRHQPRGRLDNRSLTRIAELDMRLFKRTSSPSPTPLLVWVLVDVSGSMSGQPVLDAAAVARAMADASVGTPSMRLAIWAWSDPFGKEQRRFSGAIAGVCKIWETGMPTSEVDKLTQLSMGSTPDAAVLSWAWQEMKRQAHGDEKAVVLMCSDGWGYGGALGKVVKTANNHGVDVRSVAIGNISEDQQLQVYGHGNFIPWQGGIIETARPLATLLTSLAAPKSQR